jgi:hypothetical protein
MRLNHCLLALAIVAMPFLGYSMRHWPPRYLYYSYDSYLHAKSFAWAIDYCLQLNDRTTDGLSDGQHEFCLDYVSKIKFKRLEYQSRPGQRFPDIEMLLTDN